MRRRPGIRVLLVLLATSLVLVAVAVTIVVLRQSAPDEGAGPAWAAGVLLAGTVAALAWWFSGVLLRPLEEARRTRTDAKRTREELAARADKAEAAQRRLIGLIETLSEGILELDSGGRIVQANPAARSLLRLPHDAVGQRPGALIRNLELRALVERVARGEDVAATEVTLDAHHLLVAPKRLQAAAGGSGGAVVTIVDLSELRRLESVRRDFVANVSHELKTPLTSIRGYTETLLSEDLPAETRLQFLEVVHKNAARIHSIVEDLLDLSRFESGKWLPDLKEVDAAALAREAWAAHEPSAQRKHVTFSVTGEAARVVADPEGLRHVLTNLLDNAIRYTPEGGHIDVSVRPVPSAANGRQPGMIEVAVSDNGAGIPGDALPRVFERFYRVDPARSRAEGGTGLGLAIVKHLVESMAGGVVAESELGKGTTVRVRLPAAADE